MPNTHPGPLTPSDVDDAVQFAISVFGDVPAERWDSQAGSLEWTCWETSEHIADCLFYYAGQLATRVPPTTAVAFDWAPRREGGPANIIFAERAAGTAGLMQVLEACGTFLSSIVTTANPTALAHHTYGESDPEGFAGMGVVETIVHGSDIAEGLGLDWTPPDDLCDRVLARLFRYAPEDVHGWRALQWCTGRIDLPGRPRLTEWKWNGNPL
ncbi:DinB family protein [Actinokineospora globicatena]|uniref:Mycothiol maleylpyruvate isomerase N-terminal domain-containing protein n=1 Tax=Actinokineospora globicatena TaxID=103729 RepID=A0A9W6QRS2_9PSEU|nr:DinB family protein [Actinokineospora globicatena]GLW93464.1 hypothetical protein Aglo03_42800 [Actinokineospora globicatena]